MTAIAVNGEQNGVGPISVVGDLLDVEPPAVDVVLAGDVCYDRTITERVLPFRFISAARYAPQWEPEL